MTTLIALKKPQTGWTPPTEKTLDEALWQAWRAKGRLHDLRTSAARMKALTCVVIVGLLGIAGLWAYVAPYQVLIKFLIAGSAIVMMIHSFHQRRYGYSAVFGGLAILYTPVASTFPFSGDLQRAVVVASSIPFIASLTWMNARLGHDA